MSSYHPPPLYFFVWSAEFLKGDCIDFSEIFRYGRKLWFLVAFFFIFFQKSFAIVRFLFRDQKTLFPRDLKNGKHWKIQALWNVWPICVDEVKLFCLIGRNFRSSPEVLQKLYFHWKIYMHNFYLRQLIFVYPYPTSKKKWI